MLVSPVGYSGGAEHVILTLARRLPSLGIEPVLALMRPGPLLGIAAGEGVRVHAFRDHRYRELHEVARGIRWLRRLMGEERVDLVHSNLTAHLYGGPAARFARRPEIWHIHDYPHRSSLLERALLRVPTDFALFTTETVASGYPRLRRGPYGVVYPVCLDLDAAQAQPSDGDVRSRYGLPPGPLLLTVARLQEHKGHRYLIDAVPAVSASRPDAVFVVVGKASDRTHERYLAELRRLCTDHRIADKVHFLGYVPDEDLTELYRQASALVHPALSEGFGLVILEAMAFGTPVIAAAADGPKELIRSRENGLLVPPGDSSALAGAIVELLGSPTLSRSLAAEGQQFARSLSSQHMVEDVAAIYSTLLDGLAPERPDSSNST